MDVCLRVVPVSGFSVISGFVVIGQKKDPNNKNECLMTGNRVKSGLRLLVRETGFQKRQPVENSCPIRLQ
jgi:hypothetical protein